MTQREVDPATRAVRFSCTATDLARTRTALRSKAAGELDSAALRDAWLQLHGRWLTAKATEIGIVAHSGFAIVATGSLGRCELLPQSDLDLLLLHDGKPPDAVEEVAALLWYPLWDAGVRLDHSVRTVAEAIEVAGADLLADLGMLDARHIAGDERLSAQLVRDVRNQWRYGIRSRYWELIEMTHARWKRSGEVAHRVEPDLKCGRGGLRDVQLLDALAIAQLADRAAVGRAGNRAGSVDAAYLRMLDVRTELHRVSGRGHDLLMAQYADEIGAALGIGDRYDLARSLSDAARTISYRVDAGLRIAANALPRRGISVVRPRLRRPLDDGVVAHAGEVVLARDARPERDPGLVLRVAAAAARTGLPIASTTLSRLANDLPDLPAPWPREALDDLLVLLCAGPAMVTTIEALDRSGLWGRLFPEWAMIRDLPPRDPVHIWTVDRHLIETAARAEAFTTQVARPDLLVLAALLHDIGKGSGGDHSLIGAQLVARIGTRLGLWPCDTAMLSALVTHHLLLSKVVTRHDLNDPDVIAGVAAALGGDVVLLEVLHALTEVDALATGPEAWNGWKASLVADLVRRCRLVMAGEPLPQADPIDARYVTLAKAREVHVELHRDAGGRSYRVVMIAPEQRGLLSKAAGVLALNSLRVHAATVDSRHGAAIAEFVVSPHFGSAPAAQLVCEQFSLALADGIDIHTGLRRRQDQRRRISSGEVPAGVPVSGPTAPPRILWVEGTPGRPIIEVRAADSPGLLARLAAALERAGADIVWAKVTTRGSTVDDVFCVVLAASADRKMVERHLLTALG
ncbi:[protein-PII] uridylyltransferase [[Mycobacterium] nativiensis]|uniref:Bifunctional uridylyltransferase/uridylyl-removing enzyme n=1 Tax=[Mycobacterium] nativiensis TaxID=2855503 RepID=A0ABU5Y191_9MYCO|nr:[protein-PII] uridylyltransferase [Mycolicibacter sp. MYC340]MEB3032660.1 [protein-PII] uridylyltransferase [Mycolicibacter sp. MYC340]